MGVAAQTHVSESLSCRYVILQSRRTRRVDTEGWSVYDGEAYDKIGEVQRRHAQDKKKE